MSQIDVELHLFFYICWYFQISKDFTTQTYILLLCIEHKSDGHTYSDVDDDDDDDDADKISSTNDIHARSFKVNT